MTTLPYIPAGRIASASDKSRGLLGRHKTGPRDFLIDIATRAGRSDIVDTLGGDAGKKASRVKAYINHGRWVANCECGGAEVVSPSDPIFMCLSCFNAADKGELRKVEFPKDRKLIEAVLLNRKEPGSRNWEHNETLADLKRQNADKGDKE